MRNRVAILAVTAVLPLTAVTSLTAANQAAADTRSGQVVVTGKVADCENGQSPTRVQIATSKETKADQNPGVSKANAYAVTFENIPPSTEDDGGARATATVTCPGGLPNSYTESTRIKRPTTAGDLVQRWNLNPT